MRKKAEMTTADFEAEATHEAAKQIAEIETAKEIAKVAPIEQTRDEREQLIAGVYREMGHIEALDVISKTGNAFLLLKLQKVKEQKLYAQIPEIKTWEKYCQSIGYTSKTINDKLDFLDTFGADFLETVSSFGVGYRDFKKLKKASSDGTLAIESDSVIIEGEVIQLTDKDELKEALEQLIIEQNRKLKGKDEMVKKYAEQQEIAHKAMKHAEAEQKKAEAERDTFKEKLNTIYQGRLGEVAPADREDFQAIANLEIDFNRVLGAAIRFTDKKVSEFNAQMMCAVVSKMMVAVDDIRQKLSAEHHYHFDGGILEKTELDRLSEGDTPQSFLLEE